jgi:hypothetical protein
LKFPFVVPISNLSYFIEPKRYPLLFLFITSPVKNVHEGVKDSTRANKPLSSPSLDSLSGLGYTGPKR